MILTLWIRFLFLCSSVYAYLMAVKNSRTGFDLQGQRFLLSLCVLVVSFLAPLTVFAGIVNTKHNLSKSGPGTIKSSTETQVCKFCHTPHNAEPAYPLWNHELSGVTNYENYFSNTLQSYSSEAEAPPVDGTSKLCLSCHDGTMAVSALVSSRSIDMGKMSNGKWVPDVGRLQSTDEGYLGTDLSGGHPISIIYDQSLVSRRAAKTDLNPLKQLPLTDPDVKLYPTQGGYGVQCTSCHDPHGGKGKSGTAYFLRKIDEQSLCNVCHESIEFDFPGWSQKQ